MAEVETLSDEERSQLSDSYVYHEDTGRKALRILDQLTARLQETNTALGNLIQSSDTRIAELTRERDEKNPARAAADRAKEDFLAELRRQLDELAPGQVEAWVRVKAVEGRVLTAAKAWGDAKGEDEEIRAEDDLCDALIDLDQAESELRESSNA